MEVLRISNLYNQPEMPAAIIGNSKMLASLRENGDMLRLFWPKIDYGQHLGHFWPGVQIHFPDRESMTKWFHIDTWQHSQRYLENTNILETLHTDKTHAISVAQQDFVLPDKDILVRQYTLINQGNKKERLSFLVYCFFFLTESSQFDGVYVDFSLNALVFYRRNVYLALAGSGYPLSGYQCGRRGTAGDPFQNASRGILQGNMDNIRQSAGSMAWDMGVLLPGESKNMTLFLAAGTNRNETSSLLNRTVPLTGSVLLKQTKQYWHGWLIAKTPSAAPVPSTAETTYNRSLLAMKLMSCKETGGSIAAPEFDPCYQASGGYGYCWPRDAVFTAMAFDEAGYNDQAAHFYMFAQSVQTEHGDWQQRYFTDGHPAPAWGKQIDQTGSVLFGYWHHYELTGDDFFLKQIWPSLELGANFLEQSLDTNGLPQPGFDLWEDEFCQSTYAAAAVYGGLKAASMAALRQGKQELVQRWYAAAAAVKEGIIKHQWHSRQQCFIRSINRRTDKYAYDHAANAGKEHFLRRDPADLYPTYWVGEDQRLDAALLGLAFPFRVFDAKDERMQSTALAIKERLWNSHIGGLHRYEGDCYRGGNPWLITTFWLAIYHCMCGDFRQAEKLYQWCLAQSNRHFLLPEQADKHRGGPAWVTPLNWSHAMHVLTKLALEGKISLISER